MTKDLHSVSQQFEVQFSLIEGRILKERTVRLEYFSGQSLHWERRWARTVRPLASERIKPLMSRWMVSFKRKRSQAAREYAKIFETIAERAGFKILGSQGTMTTYTGYPFDSHHYSQEMTQQLFLEQSGKYYRWESEETGSYVLHRVVDGKSVFGDSPQETLTPFELFPKRTSLWDEDVALTAMKKTLSLKVALRGMASSPVRQIEVMATEFGLGSSCPTDIAYFYFGSLYPKKREHLREISRFNRHPLFLE